MKLRANDRETEVELRHYDPYFLENCEFCGNDWKWKVFYNDDEAYDWICKVTGRADGWLLACQECFEKRVMPYIVKINA